jgi:formate dehydrogenase gamma subunit
MTENTEKILRFDKFRRIEHVLLIVSFTTLAITGLIQKYPNNPVSLGLVTLLGGIPFVRIIHRIAAVMFLLEAVYHFVVMGYILFVQRKKPTMAPGPKDAVDAIQATAHNLGLRKQAPKMGRYNFSEKAEYWALIWGLFMMGLTGLMLWNPIFTSKFLPGQFIPAAKVAHGLEAVLAVLAIILWHFYHVHIKHWNWSMIRGTISREEMEEEHTLELEEIEKGEPVALPDAKVLANRKKIFYPFAALATLILVALIVAFVTFEETAITTVPPLPEQGEVFVPQTPTPMPTKAPTATPGPQAELPSGPLTYSTGIGDIFVERCGGCHGAMGGLSVKTYDDLMKGGKTGPVVIAGDANTSLVITKLADGKHPGIFEPAELAKIIEWINAGATK